MASEKTTQIDSYKIAAAALAQMQKHGLAATPKNFEIWHAFCSNEEGSRLRSALESKLKSNDPITETALEDIYAEHIAGSKIGEAVQDMSAKLASELEQITSKIEAANSSASKYGESLAGVEVAIASAKQDPKALDALLKGLLVATAEMQASNAMLEKQLATSKTEVTDLRHNLESARSETLTDALTSLGNRKAFDEKMASLMKNSRMEKTPLCLLLIDIDHFKNFNDTWGHQTGDHVLRLVGMVLKQSVKGRDVAARYGGEEFAVILPNTSLQSAMTVAEQIRRSIMSRELVKKSTNERIGRVTISTGVAELSNKDTISSLVERADHCLYAAKRNGRNRVITESSPEVLTTEKPTSPKGKVA